MVSEDLRGKLASLLEDFSSYVETLPVIARGAESELRLGIYMGARAVFKYRRRKRYMDPALDARLRRARTLREARILATARRSGARVPRILAVFPSLYLIVMEYIEGPRLKEVIEHGDSDVCPLAVEAGILVGRLHSAGIAHGDPTTSNMILASNGLYLIDFGLAEFTSNIEDLAVDIHLFRRASEATHAGVADEMFKCFTTGYMRAMGPKAEAVLKRADEIRLRGRYVAERRRSVWQHVQED